MLAPVLASVLAGLLAGCGGAEEVTMPPLTSEPGAGLPTFSTGAAPAASPGLPAAETYPARRVLYRFLRGLAAGDTSVCALLARDHRRAAFGGQGGCRTGFAQARATLSPQDIAALRRVTVPVAEPGELPGDLVVRFETLRWRTAPARSGGVLAPQYTLRKTGGRWLIVG